MVRNAYSVKWAQGCDPDDLSREEFAHSMTGHVWTASLGNACRVARALDSNVGGSEGGIVLVTKFQDVVVSGDGVQNPDSRLPYWPTQKDVFEQYEPWGQVPIPDSGPITYTVWGNCLKKYTLGVDPEPEHVIEHVPEHVPEHVIEIELEPEPMPVPVSRSIPRPIGGITWDDWYRQCELAAMEAEAKQVAKARATRAQIQCVEQALGDLRTKSQHLERMLSDLKQSLE